MSYNAIGRGRKGRSNVHHVTADAEDHTQLLVIPRRCQIRAAGVVVIPRYRSSMPPRPSSRLTKWDLFDRSGEARTPSLGWAEGIPLHWSDKAEPFHIGRAGCHRYQLV